MGWAEAAAGIAGGMMSNKSAENATNASNAMTREQINFEKQKYFDKLQSSKNWNDYVNSNFGVVDYNTATNQANNELGAQYDDQMTDTLNDVERGLISRGFFGQAPGAALSQKAAANVASAKANAIANRASQIYDNSKSQNLVANQYGIGSFGTYGDVDTKVTEGSDGSGGGSGVYDGFIQTVFDPGGYLKGMKFPF